MIDYKERAKELIKQHHRHVTIFTTNGSGRGLVTINSAKESALITIHNQIDLLNAMWSDMDYGQEVRNYLENEEEKLEKIKEEILNL